MSQHDQVWIREFKSSSFSEEFKNYVEEKDLSYRKQTCLNFATNSWIFWSPRGEKDLHYNIIKLLEGMTIMKSCLVQFWRASEFGDGRRLLLTTRDQPFVITLPEDEATFSEGLCSYGVNVSGSYYDIQTSINAEAQERENVSVIDRVFWNRRIEFTPNVSYYSSKEYSHRELALSCGIKSCVTFPYSDSNGHFLGVIEMVSQSELDSQFWSHLQEIVSPDYLKKKGLTWMPLCQGLCGHYDGKDESIDRAMLEIHDVLKVVDTSHDLVLARTWTLCKTCDVFSLAGNFDRRPKNLLKSDFNSENNFLFAQRFCPLREGEGVVGKTLLSHGLVYCEDVSKLSVSEYPLAHFARHDNLSACFALCLCSTLTGSQVYVLEFFLRPNNFNDVKATIFCILESLIHNFKTFKLATGDKMGGRELLGMREVAIVLLENKHINMNEIGGAEPSQWTHSEENFESQCINRDEILGDNRRGKPPIKGIGAELSLQIYSEGYFENRRIDNNEILGDNRRGKSRIEVIDAERSLQTIPEGNYVDKQRKVIVTSDESIINSASVASRKGGIPIGLEELVKVSGMKRKEAAGILGISVSTLKRVCRDYDISRWPPRMRNVKNQSDSMISGAVSTIIQEGSHETAKPKFESASTIKKEEMTVTIKAKYGENFIKFQLSSCSGIDALHDQVSKRLKLEAGNYNVRYLDEDNDSILITCDEDLRGLIFSTISMGRTIVILSIESIPTLNPKYVSASSIIQDERLVTIKAIYGSNFIKFQLSSCSGIDALHDQVSKRLKLEAGTYNVKYQDEDNDWTLITCDEDLRDYISSLISMGKTTLTLSLESIA